MENNNTRFRFTFPDRKAAHSAVALFDVLGFPCGMPSLRADNPTLPASRTVLVDVAPGLETLAVDSGFACGCYGYARVSK